VSSELIARLQRHIEQVDCMAPSVEEMLARYEAQDDDLTIKTGSTSQDALNWQFSDHVDESVAPLEAEVCESCGADLMVFDLRGPDESPEPRPRERRAVVLAVAAAVLLVAGVAVVADRSSDDVATDPTSAVTTPADAIASPRATSLPLAGGDGFVDPELAEHLGCEIPSGWTQVCDAASLDGAVMYAVTAGGPGLVAVGANNLEYYAREEFAEDWDYGYGTGVPAPFGAADAVVWTSPDGLIWTRVLHDESIFGGDGSQQMFDVTVGGPGLVAVGRDGPAVDGEGDAAVWTSRDGLNWSRVPHDESVFGGPGEQRMLSVTAGGPGLVAVGFETPVGLLGRDAAVWTSIDGLDWSRVPHDADVFGGESAQMVSVTAGGPGLVAVGSDGLSTFDSSAQPFDEPSVAAAVWTSVDGLEWSRVPHNEVIFGGLSEQSMASVTVGGPGLVAVGRTSAELPNLNLGPGRSERFDAAVWTSPDGLIWTRVPHDEAVFARSGTENQNETMLSVVAGGPGLVAVGFDSDDQCGWDSAVWTSPDGFIWSRVPDERGCGNGGPYDRMLSVTVGSFGLVAVGEEHGGDPLAAAVWNG
jgi:hypothetical protein